MDDDKTIPVKKEKVIEPDDPDDAKLEFEETRDLDNDNKLEETKDEE